MGYKRPPKVYHITWTDGSMAGLEITVRSLSVGKLLALSEIEKDSNAMEVLIEPFTEALIAWNLEDEDGNPVPPTEASLREQDVEFLLKVTGKWLSAMTDVDIPLPQQLSSGGSPEAELGLEKLSQSLANS